MPNSLGHFGVQGLASHAVFGKVDPRWVMTGCILPDVPWIAQRIGDALAPHADPYTMRLYFVGQASLLGTVVLCGACAALARKPRRIFLLLAFNSLLHLLLDACQTKWGNGIQLFAPFSWEMLNFGLFWPEQWPSYVLTAGGLAYVVWAARGRLWAPFDWTARRWAVCGLLLACYAVLPALWQPSAYAADVHDAQVLKESRVGQPVAFDREEVVLEDSKARLRGWNRVLYDGGAELPDQTATVSVRGTLTAPNRIRIAELHEHSGASRDYGSVAGLAILGLALAVGVLRPRTPTHERTSKNP